MSIQAPSFRKKNPQEEGLWNLDEEWNVENETKDDLAQDPAETQVAGLSLEVAPTSAEMTDSAALPAEEEPVIRVEPSYSRRRLTRNKRRTSEAQETERVTEEMMDLPLPATEALAATQESLADSSDAPPPRAPVGLGLTEDEVWADFLTDEELVQNENPQLPQVTSDNPQPENHQPVIHQHNEQEFAENNQISEAEFHNEAEAEAAQVPADPPSGITETAANLTDDVMEPENDGDSLPGAQGNFSLSMPVFSRAELVASVLFLACLLCGGLWALSAFRKEVQTQPNLYLQPDLPATGNWATIATAETYWRAPVIEGDNADPVRQDVMMIPVIRIKLGNCAFPRGAIRVIFYNDKGDIAGDTVTHRFENQQFSGSSERTFAATTGFTNFGDQEAYRAHLVKPWTIRVYEGPDENAPSSEYRLLFSTPISTFIQ